MYETEASSATLDPNDIPTEVLNHFDVRRETITHRSQIVWAEHCTECTMPSCFNTCDYYSPRQDLKCRRFENGIIGIESKNSLVGHFMKITFRKWGKLEGKGSTKLLPTDAARRREEADLKISKIIEMIPMPYNVRLLSNRLRTKLKGPSSADLNNSSTPQPNSFVLECYNPTETPVTISLTVRPELLSGTQYQKFFDLAPGHNLFQLPISEISRFINVNEKFLAQVQPQPDLPGLTLYFGILDFVFDHKLGDFVQELSDPNNLAKDLPKIKCVVWDLDNTLWKGTLIEDGQDNLILNEQAVQILKDFDSRGILNSIASKNNQEEALAVLRKFRIEEYFLYPDISWEPKSIAIRRIAAKLNIGIDTFCFIDDQPFEIAEVSASHPNLLAKDIAEIEDLLQHPRFDITVSSESKNRRLLYKSQIERETAQLDQNDDYEKFLTSCNLILSIEPLTERTQLRVYELAQRTNQMNFSGNKYPRKTLNAIADNEDLDTFVLSCKDRFGDYGIIGFSIVRKSDATMQDLMFSCRIQSKRVDHAFLSHIINKYHNPPVACFHVEYKISEKNTPSAQIFSEMSFIEVGKIGDKTILEYPKAAPLPTNNIVEIIQR